MLPSPANTNAVAPAAPYDPATAAPLTPAPAVALSHSPRPPMTTRSAGLVAPAPASSVVTSMSNGAKSSATARHAATTARRSSRLKVRVSLSMSNGGVTISAALHAASLVVWPACVCVCVCVGWRKGWFASQLLVAGGSTKQCRESPPLHPETVAQPCAAIPAAPTREVEEDRLRGAGAAVARKRRRGVELRRHRRRRRRREPAPPLRRHRCTAAAAVAGAIGVVVAARKHEAAATRRKRSVAVVLERAAQRGPAVLRQRREQCGALARVLRQQADRVAAAQPRAAGHGVSTRRRREEEDEHQRHEGGHHGCGPASASAPTRGIRRRRDHPCSPLLEVAACRRRCQLCLQCTE